MSKFTRIGYQFQPDERPTPPVLLGVDDDSGDWLIGAMRGFAGIAFAATLATQALAAQQTLAINTSWQQDEITTIPAFVLQEDDWTPSIFVQAKSRQAFIDDEVLGSLRIDETDWIGRVPFPANNRFPSQWSWEQGEQADSLYGALYETDFVPSVRSSQRPSVVFTADEEFVLDPEPTLTVNESDWQVVPRIQTYKATVFQGDEDHLAVLGIDESDWSALLAKPLPSVPRPFTADEELPLLVLTAIEESDDLVIRSKSIVRAPLVVVDDEQITYAPVVIALDEDAIVIIRPQASVRPQVFTDDEVIGTLRVDEADWTTLVRSQSIRPIQVIGDDDLPITPVTFVEESDWLVVVRQVSNKPVVFIADEEYAQQQVVEIQEDEWSVVWPVLVRPLAQVFSADDELPVFIISVLVEEDDSYSPPRPMHVYKIPSIVFTTNDDHRAFAEIVPVPPFSQPGCCNVSGTAAIFSSCVSSAIVPFDDCACPS